MDEGRPGPSTKPGKTQTARRVFPVATGSLAAPRDPPDDPLAKLKALLAARRYDMLVDRWDTVVPPLRIPWAKEILFEGGSVAVAAPLARDLWMAAPVDGAGTEPRVTAVKVVLYAYLRLRIDGERCVDASGPGDRIRDLRFEFHRIIAYAASLPQGVIQSLALEVVDLESRTADRRGPDPFACSRGRLGLRTGHFLDSRVVDGLVVRRREAAVAEVLGLARR